MNPFARLTLTILLLTGGLAGAQLPLQPPAGAVTPQGQLTGGWHEPTAAGDE